MLTSDTNNVLTAEPASAKDALVGSTGFTTQSDSDAHTIRLMFTIEAVDTPDIFLVQFKTKGISDVLYYFTNGVGSVPLDLQTPPTDGTSAVVYKDFPTPVSANNIVIILTPAEPNSEVKVYGLSVQACYTPGRFDLQINT